MMNVHKIRNLFVATALTCSMVVVPVFGAPNTSEIENQKKAAEGEVSSLQSQLNSLMTTMHELEGQLIAKGQEITQAKENLVVAEEKQAQQYEDMKLRIKYMYEEGNGSALERILVSGSIAELLTEADYVEKVHAYDREMLQEYAATVKEIDTLKATLETDMTNLQSLEKSYQTQSQECQSMLSSKQAEVAGLDTMLKEAAEAALAEQKRQEEEKKLADQKKAAEAAKNESQASNSNSSNSSSSNSDSGNAGSSNTTQPTVNPPSVPEVSAPDTGNVGYAEPDYSVATGNAIVDRAYSWVNRAEYSWGACSPGAFDCSGFVSYCLSGSYSRMGTTFTFLTWPQVSEPQPGDVCVNANHCGIYIGDGQMIHAATEGVGVVVGPVQGGMIYVRY